MDNIIVPATTIDETLVRLEHVFQRLQQANLNLKPSKCIFMQKSVKWLGHEVSALGINTNKDKSKQYMNDQCHEQLNKSGHSLA